MSNFDKVMTVWLILLGSIASSFTTQQIMASDIKAFNESVHCTPITKHTGIESAKDQVAKYQAMVRG